MMISESVGARITDFYYHYAASEELRYSINMTLLQAMWDTDEQITDDELVKLAVQIIWDWVEPDSTD